MKITFYYENGTSYTANNVEDFDDNLDYLHYTSEKVLAKGINSTTSVIVSKDILVAYVIQNEETTKIVKVKPCAIIDVAVSTTKWDY